MRRFEHRDDGSAKFWEIETKGQVVSTRWGRLGSDGTTTLKDVGSEAKAKAEAEKQIRSKLAKGYVEVGASGAANIRAVAHYGVDAGDIEEALEIVRATLNEGADRQDAKDARR